LDAYEHVVPEFNDAKEHDPTKMTLLCPQCHAKVTTGFWSKEKVHAAMKSPKSKSQGFSKEVFDLGNGHPVLQFGGASLRNCPVPIEVGGLPLFKIEGPEEVGAPFRLSGFFCDSTGKVSLQIIENEWLASSNNWDVDVGGGTITIREDRGNIHLRLLADPPDKLIIDRLNMTLNGRTFEANGNFLRVGMAGGGAMEFTSCIADNCAVGMAF
jgi:hypothetical protein